MQSKNILIVDDDEDILSSIELAMRAEGAVTSKAADGSAAVLACQTAPDAVVLDMMLPKASGFVVMEKIREMDRPPVVVVITANQGKRHQQYAHDLGVHAYMNKPVSLQRWWTPSCGFWSSRAGAGAIRQPRASPPLPAADACRYSLTTVATQYVMLSRVRRRPGAAALPPSAAAREIVNDLSRNTASDGTGDEVLYGPGIRIEIPPGQGPVTQMLMTVVEEEIAWLVIMRLAKAFSWKIVDVNSGPRTERPIIRASSRGESICWRVE